MRQYSPVRFNEVSVEGAFWRERLDTVLTQDDPEPVRAARANMASSNR